jgi:hypothetical protein
MRGRTSPWLTSLVELDVGGDDDLFGACRPDRIALAADVVIARACTS